MSEKHRSANVVVMRLNQRSVLSSIQQLALDSRRVFITSHAQERMAERSITDSDVFSVLRKGNLKGDPSPGQSNGEWKCKMVAKLKGTREIGVVTILKQESKLIIVTVEWEDL